jgi:Nucleotidyltransferase
VRLKEDGDSLVMPGVPIDERDMLVESQPKLFYFTDHYKDYPMVLIRLSKAKRLTVEPLLRRRWRTLASKDRGAQSGARPSLVSGKTWPALPALHCSTDGIDRFLTKNTQIGIRPTKGGHDVYAPNGFDDIANMIVRPKGPNFSPANYAAKAMRWKMLWPEITVLGVEAEL